MSNTYFQFKQFQVEQQHSGMKVTTEGCLFGAWVASLNIKPRRILDIGAGTGLLSLMVAQKYSAALITAVEINEQAAEEAAQNYETSPFADRLSLVQQPIQQFESFEKFDLIISNPPFFKNSLSAQQNHHQLARHDDSLSQKDLLLAIQSHLAEEGQFFILFPEREMKAFEKLAKDSGFTKTRHLDVYNKLGGPVFRKMCGFAKHGDPAKNEQIFIRTTDNAYSLDFVQLLKDYYLLL